MGLIKNVSSKIFISPIKVLASKKPQPLKKAVSGVAVGIFSVLSLGGYAVFAFDYYKNRNIQPKGDDLKGISLASPPPTPPTPPPLQNFNNEKKNNFLSLVNANDVKNAKKMLKKDPSLILVGGEKGMGSLFTECVVSGKHDMVELFLKHSVPPDQFCRLGGGTLEAAIILGDFKMVKLLQEYGSTPPKKPLMILYTAAEYGQDRERIDNPNFPEIIDWLIKEAEMDIKKESPYFQLINDLDNPYANQIKQALKEKGVNF